MPIRLSIARGRRRFGFRAKGVIQKKGQRIDRFYCRDVAPGYPLPAIIASLFRTGNDAACQRESIRRGEINPAQKRRYVVVIMRIIPSGNESTGHAKRLENRIGKKTAQVAKWNSKEKIERIGDVVVVSAWLRNDFRSQQRNEQTAFELEPLTHRDGSGHIRLEQLGRRLLVKSLPHNVDSLNHSAVRPNIPDKWKPTPQSFSSLSSVRFKLFNSIFLYSFVKI